MPNFSDLKFIDLFCGIGGFHIALKRLGAQCVVACDTDKRCREVYQANFGIVPETDVRELNPGEMPDFDIICGGFPCQPFSNAGKKLTLDDDRGLLFDEIIRLAVAKRPKFMFLENVKHILKVGGGEVGWTQLDHLVSLSVLIKHILILHVLVEDHVVDLISQKSLTHILFLLVLLLEHDVILPLCFPIFQCDCFVEKADIDHQVSNYHLEDNW